MLSKILWSHRDLWRQSSLTRTRVLVRNPLRPYLKRRRPLLCMLVLPAEPATSQMIASVQNVERPFRSRLSELLRALG